jgi:sugar lactone lactonase YvrE
LDGRVYKTTSGDPTAIAGTGNFDFGDGGPATGAGLGFPNGVALDSSGNLYIADGGLVRKVTPAGTISTVAGGGSAVPGDGGPATGARLSGLCGIAVDSAGNLYIGETSSNVVRKVTPAGIISTVAGNRILGGSGDGGSATAAALANPNGVALDSAGNLYIADLNNNRVRKVTPGGTISTVAGGSLTTDPGDGGPATKAYVGAPTGVAVDAAGNLYITEQLNCRVRKVTTDGTISTVAGNGNCGYTNADGSATGVALYYPKGVTVDIGGNVYVAASMWIRKVTPDGIISSIAGNGYLGYSGDGGPATDATLNNPTLLAADSAGRIYIADTFNNAVRMLTPATAAPSISAGGVVPASSTVNTIQAGQWVSIYGSNLAGTTANWTGNFPTTLGGTSVTIDGKPAYLS